MVQNSEKRGKCSYVVREILAVICLFKRHYDVQVLVDNLFIERMMVGVDRIGVSWNL